MTKKREKVAVRKETLLKRILVDIYRLFLILREGFT